MCGPTSGHQVCGTPPLAKQIKKGMREKLLSLKEYAKNIKKIVLKHYCTNLNKISCFVNGVQANIHNVDRPVKNST